MIIYGVGNEADSYGKHLSPRFDTDAKGADAAYNIVTSHGGNARLDLSSAIDECWIHFNFLRVGSNITTNNPFFGLLNVSTGKLAFRLVKTLADGSFVAQYNNTGTTYTTIGTTVYLYSSVAVSDTIDIYFKRGAGGVLKIFVNGTLIINETGSFSTVDSTWDAVYLGGPRTDNTDVQYGDLIVADSPLFGYSLDSLAPSAGGTVNTWDGTFADIVGASGAIDKLHALHTNATGQSALFGIENMTTLAAYRAIKGVSIATAGSLDSAGTPTGASLLVRHSSSNYTLSALGFTEDYGLMRNQQNLVLNPAGGVWTESDINALEVGVVSS